MQRSTTVAPPRFVPHPDRILKLDFPESWLLGAGGRRVAAGLEKVTGLDQINALYDQAAAQGPVAPGGKGSGAFAGRLLSAMNVRWRISTEDMGRIPRKGPVIVVANHPFGALDGLILSAVLAEVRDDVKVLANYLLGRVPELRDLFFLVDPFHKTRSASRNLSAMRRSVRWLNEGHLLAAFPAGEVSHLTLRNFVNPEGLVIDPPWTDTIARLALRTEVPVLPIYFDGRNSAIFQAAGLIHPVLRTALLPRALLGKRGQDVTLRVGSLIPARRLIQMGSDQQVTDYLRRRTLLLRHGVPRPSVAKVAGLSGDTSTAAKPVPAVPPDTEPGTLSRWARAGGQAMRALRAKVTASPNHPESIIPPVDPSLMEAEIAALPAESILLEHEGMAVITAAAPQIRMLLREIGRLREVTFRKVGEGTGRSVDLDTFDYDYLHLLIWNRADREVVGAYRLGQTDRLLPTKGRNGLYTSTLFHYKAELLDRLNPALEMGRSFVRPEYQRSYAPLLLLWKGIGHFLVRHPNYRYLFGPVSISNSYQTVSRELMVNFLKLHHAMPEAENFATPRHPFKPKKPLRLGLGHGTDTGIGELLRNDEEVSSLIADLEPDQKGIPVLIRQYLKLGAKFLAFNVDRGFGDCVDGLLVVDLLHTEGRVLERYMTKAGYASFRNHHRCPPLSISRIAAAASMA